MDKIRNFAIGRDVVRNAGRSGNHRAAARQPGIVPGKKKH